MRVTVDDVSAVGALIDAGVNAGANRVTSLQFEARNTDAARATARVAGDRLRDRVRTRRLAVRDEIDRRAATRAPRDYSKVTDAVAQMIE